MANTYKSIVITPNKSSNTADPNISFRGGNTTANTTITMTVYPDANGTLSFDGNAGQLFSITNDLSNSIFAVSDVSGIPSLEIFANGAVILAGLSGNVGIGNSAPAHKLRVEGAVSINGILHANGTNGTSGQVLTSNGTGIYWSTVSGSASANSTGGNGAIQYYNGTSLGSSTNLVFNGTNIFLGNTTANSNYGQTSLAVANSTNTATLTPISLTIGTQIANTLGFYAGANVYANTTTVFFGNSTVNSVHTATTLGFYANSTVNTVITAAAANSITINGFTIGYLEVPQNSQSAAYGLVRADSGKHILHPASDNNARTFTIPANANVAYPTGTVLTFTNMANTVTIAITTDTLYLAGVGTTGSRTLAAYGIATAIKINTSAWVISGTGLS